MVEMSGNNGEVFLLQVSGYGKQLEQKPIVRGGLQASGKYPQLGGQILRSNIWTRLMGKMGQALYSVFLTPDGSKSRLEGRPARLGRWYLDMSVAVHFVDEPGLSH